MSFLILCAEILAGLFVVCCVAFVVAVVLLLVVWFREG